MRAHTFLSLNLQQLLLFAATISLFAAIIFYLQQLYLTCSNFILFAGTLFNLQQRYFICSNFIKFAATFLFAACPLWATVV